MLFNDKLYSFACFFILAYFFHAIGFSIFFFKVLYLAISSYLWLVNSLREPLKAKVTAVDVFLNILFIGLDSGRVLGFRPRNGSKCGFLSLDLTSPDWSAEADDGAFEAIIEVKASAVRGGDLKVLFASRRSVYSVSWI